VHCNLSIGTLDEAVWKATEPGTPHPRQRVEAVRRLNDAGIPTGVLVAPIIPGWSDTPEQLAEVAAACVEAGAVFVTPIALHLRRGVKEHFLAFLKEARPDLHAETARRYARSAYLSPAEQREITERVDSVVQPARRRSTADTFGHPGSGRDGSPSTDTGPGAAPAAEQLAFLPAPTVRPR
jgi:DNA repair photolyase